MVMPEQNVMDRIRRDYTAAGMEEIVLRLDLLHDYAAADRINELTTLSQAELHGWLQELIFVARETLHEMEDA